MNRNRLNPYTATPSAPKGHRARVRFLATPELLTFKCQPNFLNFQQARTFNRFLRLVFCDSFRGQRSDLAATRVERTSPRWQVLAYGTEKDFALWGGK